MAKMNFWFGTSLLDLCRANIHTDCTFIIDIEDGSMPRKEFVGHRLIYSCASIVFDRMLYDNPHATSVVILNDVEPYVFEKFRDYMYGTHEEGLQSCDFNTLLKLVTFGKKYMAESLQKDCESELVYRMDRYEIDKLLRLFQFAHTQGQTRLLDLVRWKLQTGSESELSNDGIYEFSKDVFKLYIQAIEGVIREAARFNVIEMYLAYHQQRASANASCLEAGDGEADQSVTLPSSSSSSHQLAQLTQSQSFDGNYTSELLNLINFQEFSPKEYEDGPQKSNLFSLQEMYDHMSKIARRCEASLAHSQITLNNLIFP